MTNPLAPAQQIASALRSKDLTQARNVLEKYSLKLNPNAVARFQAQIALAEGHDKKAADLLTSQFGPSPTQPQCAVLLARAHLSLGNPDAAGSAIKHMAENLTVGVVGTRLSVLAATRAKAALMDLARTVLTQLQDAAGLQEYTLNCVLEVNGVEQALELLETTSVAIPMRQARLRLVTAAIRGGNCDTVARSLDQLPQDDQLPTKVLNSFSTASLDRTLPEIEEILAQAADLVVDERSLVSLSQICIQLDLIVLGKALFERGQKAFDPQSFPALANRKDLTLEETKHLGAKFALTMDWLGIPAEDRHSWLCRVGMATEFHKANRFYSMIAPGYIPPIIKQRARPDLGALRRMNESESAGIIAISHIGSLINTLDFFHENDVDTTIIGGHILRKLFYPGGQRLVPIQEEKPKAKYARISTSTLMNNRLLTLAIDVGHGKPVTFLHHGVRLSLNPTVPRLALKYNVPVFWGCSHIVGSELRFDFEQMALRDPAESDDSFAVRLMTSFADNMREICLSDPINAAWASHSICTSSVECH